MEKVKNITKETRIVTLIRYDKERNYKLFTWVAKDEEEALARVNDIIDLIKTDEREPMKLEWITPKSNVRLFFEGEYGVWEESKFIWDFHITRIHEQD